jgi:hypothetical protein
MGWMILPPLGNWTDPTMKARAQDRPPGQVAPAKVIAPPALARPVTVSPRAAD